MRSILLSLMLISFDFVKSYHQTNRRALDLFSLRSSSGNFDGYRQSDTKTGAYDIAASSLIKMPCIILVNPFLDQNVGSVSRAMLNFGLTELRVVDPNCNILSDNARALASGSIQILENAKIYSTVKECVADLHRVFATTVRPRHMTQMVLTPAGAAVAAISQDPEIKVGIMFGRERSGLTNDEVAEADSIISIPSFKHFSSLNLAQAVNIVGSELWNRNLVISEYSPPDVWLHPRDGERLARRHELENFLGRLEVSLDDRNYQMNPSIRELNHRHIKNIFQRVMVTKAEVDMLHGVLSCLTKEKINNLLPLSNEVSSIPEEPDTTR